MSEDNRPWPRDLQRFVDEACGARALIEPLAGLSGAAVWRVEGSHLQAVANALTGAILHCKAAVVVEFMAMVVTEGLTLDPAYAELWRSVPAWVAQIAGDEQGLWYK